MTAEAYDVDSVMEAADHLAQMANLSALQTWFAMSAPPLAVLSEVLKEHARQLKKWGPQDHAPLEWLAILTEEVGEVAQEALRHHFGPDDPGDNYRTELIQVAAVALSAVVALDRGAWARQSLGHAGYAKPEASPDA